MSSNDFDQNSGGGDVFKYSGELCRNFLCKV